MNGADTTASPRWEKRLQRRRPGAFEICSRWRACAESRPERLERQLGDDRMNFYRLLLHLYPSSFRAEYGAEMSALFALELDRKRGLPARWGLWSAAMTEIVFNATMVHWEIARRDLFHSARSLLRSPGFTLTAVLLVTIGIGANIAVFALANFVLVRPLPFPQADRLVKVWEKHPGYSRMELSPANYRDLNASSRSFTALAAFTGYSMSLIGQGEPQRIAGATVTANLFSVLERPVLFGRYFNHADGQAGAPGTVVLTYSLWQTAFGGDRDIVGKPVSLDNQPFTVIGVMPADFHFPTRETLFWTPFRFEEADYQDRDNNMLEGIGRLKPGVSLAQARSELLLIAARLRKQYRKKMKRSICQQTRCVTNSRRSRACCSKVCVPQRSVCWSSSAPTWQTFCWRAPWPGNESSRFACRWEPTG